MLRDSYDVLLVDLDGTVYRGEQAIPGAHAALGVRAQPIFYVTNNASRSPGAVAVHLRELGFDASESVVVTSSQSAARMVAEKVEPGSPVLVVGTEALADEVARVGLKPVRQFGDEPVAVVQGHSPTTDWAILAEASLALRSGAVWVAANVDTTLPTERGLVLGNGSMVAALRAATGREPLVAGKPYAPLMEDALRHGGSRNALVIGDRLDTDIAGANTVGVDSLLVLTGVSTAAELLRAPEPLRPTYVGASLDALNAPAELSAIGASPQWTASFDGGDVVLEAAHDTAAPTDPLAALRAVLEITWRHPEFDRIRPSGAAAESAMSEWMGRV